MTLETNRDRPQQQTSGSTQRPARTLAGDSLQFNLDRELDSLRGEASWLRGDRNARTLVEAPSLRVTLVAMKPDSHLREHQTDGWVSFQVLSGTVRVHLPKGPTDLGPGDLLSVEQGVVRDVEAVVESAFLLTVAMNGPSH